VKIDLHCLRCETELYRLHVDPEGLYAQCQEIHCDHIVRLDRDIILADEFGMLFRFDGEESKASGKLLDIMDGR